MITVRCDDGSVGMIHYTSDGNTSLPKEFVEVHGGGVSAQLLNFRKLVVHGAKVRGRTRYFEQVKGFAEEAAAVVAAVRSGGPAPISFDDLYATSRAAILADQRLYERNAA